MSTPFKTSPGTFWIPRFGRLQRAEGGGVRARLCRGGAGEGGGADAPAVAGVACRVRVFAASRSAVVPGAAGECAPAGVRAAGQSTADGTAPEDDGPGREVRRGRGRLAPPADSAEGAGDGGRF